MLRFLIITFIVVNTVESQMDLFPVHNENGIIMPISFIFNSSVDISGKTDSELRDIIHSNQLIFYRPLEYEKRTIDQYYSEILHSIKNVIYETPVTPPQLRIELPSSNSVIDEGEEIVLNCFVVSLLPVTVKWIRNGNIYSELTGTTSVKLSAVIETIDKSDEGSWYCVAENSDGKRQAKTHLRGVYYDV